MEHRVVTELEHRIRLEGPCNEFNLVYFVLLNLNITILTAIRLGTDKKIPYSRVIRRISHISAYSLISAYVFAATKCSLLSVYRL